ncbi:MAG: oxidoreductase [Acidimicrobiia bacterium]|nr:oxidoreductase [Acidimicrobiia bacterium]MDH5289356.1 oxidoreductase [Acidimicrobiia bacterium]
MTFHALLLEENDGKVSAAVAELDDSRLPAGDVTVGVEWSSLNYKDGMILQGLGRLVRDYPHVGGIDLAGTVEASDDPRYAPGDKVALTGWRVGETHWGGYASRARVRADWLVPVPAALTTRQAMAVGTAGFTAMQALVALERHGIGSGPDAALLATGASGGVGSSAVLWASAAGHHVVASTGRLENADELTALGAAEVINRAELAEHPSRPLLSERWGSCIDAVGGDTLAHVLTEIRYGGAVAACGLAGGNGLATTVVPFLLRGVSLLGIDSVMCPADHRAVVWGRIGDLVAAGGPADVGAKLDSLITEVPLADLPALAPAIMAGQVKGRVVVDCTS